MTGSLQAELVKNAAFDASDACEMYLDHRERLDAESAPDERLKLKAVFGGAYHSLLLTETGNVYACGLNNMGQLGRGCRGLSRNSLVARSS